MAKQQQMLQCIEGRRVVLLSDHALISRAIELALNGGPLLTILDPGPELFVGCSSWGDPPMLPVLGDCDLIIVAVSFPSTEPVVALARSSLLGRVGRVPLLIISDRPFGTMPESKISHLRFPFDPARLRATVCELLACEESGRLRPVPVVQETLS